MSICIPRRCETAGLSVFWSGAEVALVEPARACDAAVRGGDAHELVQLSSVAYLRNAGRYEALIDGATVSWGMGPWVVSNDEGSVESVKGQRLVLPGEDSAEALLADTFLPAFTPVQTDDCLAALRRGEAFAAVIDAPIPKDVSCMADLGERFAKYHAGVVLPLRLWCVRRDLADERRGQIIEELRRTLARSAESLRSVVDAAMELAEGAERDAVERFIVERAYAPDNGDGDAAVWRGLDVLREYTDADYYAANGRF